MNAAPCDAERLFSASSTSLTAVPKVCAKSRASRPGAQAFCMTFCSTQPLNLTSHWPRAIETDQTPKVNAFTANGNIKGWEMWNSCMSRLILDRPTFGSDKHPWLDLRNGQHRCASMIFFPPFIMRMQRGQVWKPPMLNNTVNHGIFLSFPTIPTLLHLFHLLGNLSDFSLKNERKNPGYEPRPPILTVQYFFRAYFSFNRGLGPGP